MSIFKEVVPTLQALLERPSITPDDSGCQQFIAQHLKKAGFHCEFLRFAEVDNLWATIGTEKPLFVFAGHTDVVPPGPLAEWTSPPFKPDIRENYLYGRGAVDMKGALAAMLVAAQQFLKNHSQFNGSIGFLLTSDEEGPSINGTRKVIETLNARGTHIDYCLVGEPSSEHQLLDQMRVGRRGSLHGKLTVHGKQGHVAHPHLATNPIHKALLALHELAHIEWDQGNDFFPPTTFQLTNVNSGTGALNVIPGHLDLFFNFRFSSAVTHELLKKRVEDLLNLHALDYQLDWTIGALPFLSSQGSLLTVAQNIITQLTGKPAKLSTGGGTSDARFIAPTGTEVIELGLLHKTAHQIDECVCVDDLLQLTECYYEILTALFH